MDVLDKKTKAVVVCGPTATGKTELAFSLCERFGGELIGADSMQIYKGLSVGTAAPLAHEYPNIKRHLVSFLSPQESFSVAQYVQAAEACVHEVAQRDALPVLCGGTGLYVDSLVNGISFTEKKIDNSIILELEERWQSKGGAALWQQLAVLDAEGASRLHPNDKKRIVQSLAQAEQNQSTMATRHKNSKAQQSKLDTLVIVLCDHERAHLYQRIETRVDRMMQSGLLQEAEWVYQNKENFKTAVQAIGYKELFAYFKGEQSLDSCVALLKQATRRYAKRQLTWFRRHSFHVWLSGEDGDVQQRAEAEIRKFMAR